MWQTDFTMLLKSEFEKKKAEEADFSLNKFAKVAGVSAGTMSELFNGNKRDWTLTEDRAAEIVSRLPLSQISKNRMLVKMGRAPEINKEDLDASKFEFLLDWKHQGVVMALDLPAAERTPTRLCERFDLSPTELHEILETALFHGMVYRDVNGECRRHGKYWSTTDNIPNSVLRQIQVNNTELIQQALKTTPTDKRDCTALTFIGSQRQIEVVRKELRAAIEKVQAVMNDEENNDEVYQISISLIPLSKTTKENK